MATASQAKRTVLFGGAVVTGLTALDYTATQGGLVPIRVVVGGLLATAALLALADVQPEMAYGFVMLALLTSLLVPTSSGRSRVELLRLIGKKL